MSDRDRTGDIAGIACLDEPVRRRLYDAVTAHGEPMSREQAATAADVAVHTAKFHLDKLAEAGLLDVEFRRLNDRTGPGSGRPSKLYRRSEREINVALPSRHYDLLSRILARAIVEAERSGDSATAAAKQVAYDEGRTVGETGRHCTPPIDLVTSLRDSGYEPHEVDGEVTLRNCPFHRAATEQAEFVCAVNLDFVTGVRDGLGCTGTDPVLDPAAGRCCVVLRPRD
ncbi:MAG TPA: helix-turn-helix domain-containing protein [Aeromicrobium sp.]|nr:helix-turn-helix domain-containing protein [Aeromicrobium sp.]